MKIKQVEFVGSFPRLVKCPKSDKPEYAFIGRSNVGKSSLINMLAERKGIAQVSGQPGKTRMLNFYLINEAWHMVDLPGYGYAKVSKKTRAKFREMIRQYFVGRENLQCIFVLLDSKIPLQKLDLEFINELGEMQVPFVLVYTKVDRLKRMKKEDNIEKIEAALLEYWNQLPQQFETSAKTGQGRDELLAFIEQINQQYGK